MEDQNKNKNSYKNKQFELFRCEEIFESNYNLENNINFSQSSLLNWREKIHKHQNFIRTNLSNLSLQKSLFANVEEKFINIVFNKCLLTINIQKIIPTHWKIKTKIKILSKISNLNYLDVMKYLDQIII